MGGDGGKNPLVEAAEQIGVTDNNEQTQGSSATEAAPRDNKVGSYESFMHSFGSPRRWAGANS